MSAAIKGIANPVASILSAALLLRYSVGSEQAAQAVENAIATVLAGGARTADLVPRGSEYLSTTEMGERIVRALQN